MKKVKPIFLFADSQLLFYTNKNGLFLERVRSFLAGDAGEDRIKAAYIGASNDDAPQFYEVFEAAMRQIGVRSCRMIKSNPLADDTIFLKNADIILLSGGDTDKGWSTIQRNGWDSLIAERHSRGVILIGVSAGAVQLGVKGFQRGTSFGMLRLIPFIVDVHADDFWQRLAEDVISAGENAKGIGIPIGGGLVYHPDESLEAIQFPCIEFRNTSSGIKSSLIQPFKRHSCWFKL